MGGGQWSKWMILVATIWIQAFTGTNFDFSSYSSDLKLVLGISQLQLNYLSMASDMGKALGWCSGVSLLYFPLWVVMFMAALMGFFGYGLQWLVIQRFISLPYFLVFMLCFLGGCSICWFNTVCYVLCIRNFPTSRPLALSLTVSFNGVSAALYTLIANAIDSNDHSLYLILNAVVPLFISILTLIPVLTRQPPLPPRIFTSNAIRDTDSLIFLCLYILAAITGLYLLFLDSLSSNLERARILLVGAVIFLVLPLCVPGIACARECARPNIHFSSHLSKELIDLEPDGDLELRKELIAADHSSTSNGTVTIIDKEGYSINVMEKDRVTMLGEEHPAGLLVYCLDFWLYFVSYFCGGTLGLVYSNNLGQISESLGYTYHTSSLVTIYSLCSFFGRLLSAAPDFLSEVYHPRTGWLAVALLPTPIAFFMLAASGGEVALYAGTALIGISSGFVFSAAVSITSELFGPNSAAVNHNILITNIPIGSLFYGLLASLVYDSNEGSSSSTILEMSLLKEATICMGRKCYWQTFIWWGCISILGLASSFLLFLRTRPAYNRFEMNRCRPQSSSEDQILLCTS